MNKQACWLCVNEGTFKDAGKCYYCNSSRTSSLPNNYEAKPIEEMIEIFKKEIERLEDIKNGLPEIAPCIHCGKVHRSIINSFKDGRYRVCETIDGLDSNGEVVSTCHSSGPSMETEKEAILAWNKQNKSEAEKEGKHTSKNIHKIVRVSDGVHWSGGEEGWGGRKAMLYYTEELMNVRIGKLSPACGIKGEWCFINKDKKIVAKAVEIAY